MQLPTYSFVSKAKLDEIFIFCASRFESAKCRYQFGAVAYVEILKIKEFCERVLSALPENATFFGKKVEYYTPDANCSPRWALPDKIAISKRAEYAWQNEYRLLFSMTNALQFENVDLALVSNDAPNPENRTDFTAHPLKIGAMADICRLHLI
jgi:hypothetical protein